MFCPATSILFIFLLAIAGDTTKAPKPAVIHSFAGLFKVVVKDRKFAHLKWQGSFYSLFILFVLYIGLCAAATRMKTSTGPFKLVFKSIENCPDDMRGTNVVKVTGVTKQTRQYPDRRFYGNIEHVISMDDNLTLEAAMATWNNVRGWLPNAFHLKFSKLCTTMYTVFKNAVDLLQQYEVNHQKLCPRGPGNYTVQGLPLTYSVKMITAFPYGRWRGDFHYSRNDEKVGCLRFLFDTVPDY